MNHVGFCIGLAPKEQMLLTAVGLFLTEGGKQMQMQLLIKWETHQQLVSCIWRVESFCSVFAFLLLHLIVSYS